jgi:hypothetical protein
MSPYTRNIARIGNVEIIFEQLSRGFYTVGPVPKFIGTYSEDLGLERHSISKPWLAIPRILA